MHMTSMHIFQDEYYVPEAVERVVLVDIINFSLKSFQHFLPR
jgi:hypothetical protein